MLSQDELEVLEILLALPELIASSRPSTVSKNNSLKSWNWKRSRTALRISPTPPRPKTYEELQKKYAGLTERKEALGRELEKVRSYHEEQINFNSFLRKAANRLIRPSMAASTAVKVEEDYQNQETSVGQTIRKWRV